jgi:hypothetical protein
MPLLRKRFSLRGIGYRKLDFKFAAAKHPSKRAKNLAGIEWLETSMNTEILSLQT